MFQDQNGKNDKPGGDLRQEYLKLRGMKIHHLMYGESHKGDGVLRIFNETNKTNNNSFHKNEQHA